jgi:hydrogenase maturation protein HypF
MASNINAVKKICKVSKKEESILSGIRRPIVLLKKKHNCILPDEIAPMQNTLGVMLSYTPLHYLLFCRELECLIVTSGNISGMPICYKDTDAFSELKGVADCFLVHNRDIVVPVDDSVVRVVGKKEMVSRCGRGYSPAVLPIKTKQNIIALGAEQKSSITILQKGYATLSQYLGDVKTYDTYLTYNYVLKHLKSVFKVSNIAYAHDLNPDYLSSKYALQQEGIKIAVQHHHAHMAGCIAEHGLAGRVIGVIYDGTGLGTDGAVWGGEILVGTTGEYERVAHWQYVTLQGGDMLVKEPWRGAVCYLRSIGIDAKKILKDIDKNDIDDILKAIKAKILCCQSSSIGRLFDAVAVILGVKTKITYDAQAAIELETIANPTIMDYYNFTINEESQQIIIGYEHIIKGILKDLRLGIIKSVISAKFHNTIINATVECVNRVREKTKINDVVLGGGVFENQYLLKGLIKKLKKKGFNTYHNLRVPINDGGISFGQAAVAAELLKEMDYVPCDTC